MPVAAAVAILVFPCTSLAVFTVTAVENTGENISEVVFLMLFVGLVWFGLVSIKVLGLSPILPEVLTLTVGKIDIS